MRQRDNQIESQSHYLFDDVNAVIELLAFEHRMNVVEEGPQVLLAVAVRDHDGHLVSGQALRRLEPSAGLELWQQFLQLIEGRTLCQYFEATHCSNTE